MDIGRDFEQIYFTLIDSDNFFRLPSDFASNQAETMLVTLSGSEWAFTSSAVPSQSGWLLQQNFRVSRDTLHIGTMSTPQHGSCQLVAEMSSSVKVISQRQGHFRKPSVFPSEGRFVGEFLRTTESLPLRKSMSGLNVPVIGIFHCIAPDRESNSTMFWERDDLEEERRSADAGQMLS